MTDPQRGPIRIYNQNTIPLRIVFWLGWRSGATNSPAIISLPSFHLYSHDILWSQAYPDWSWHTAGRGDINCTGLISVYRVRADRCNRLWVLDAGVVTSIDDFRRVCPPKILIFDMATDRLVSVDFKFYVSLAKLTRKDKLIRNFWISFTKST